MKKLLLLLPLLCVGCTYNNNYESAFKQYLIDSEIAVWHEQLSTYYNFNFQTVEKEKYIATYDQLFRGNDLSFHKTLFTYYNNVIDIIDTITLK